MQRALLFLLVLLTTTASAGRIEGTTGRTQLVVRSSPYRVVSARSVEDQALQRRLDRLGYQRVERRPSRPGTWQRTDDAWWIFRREHRYDGKRYRAQLLGYTVNDGLIVGAMAPGGRSISLDARGVWLEPEVLAESWKGDRAARVYVPLTDLPEHAWRPLLALEDDRFFTHAGVSGQAIARAALANAKKGGVSQGGSTITQQLVKNRDLTSKRSLDRKASEAVRALALEAEHSKEEILEAYLNTVYYGHVRGVAIYGIGRASLVVFGKPASKLELHEAALLAAVVQGPNAMHPIRHPQRAKRRRDHALDRMQTLGWATAPSVAQAKAKPLGANARSTPRQSSRHLLDRVEQVVLDDASHRRDRGLGFEIDTTIDPWLQARATALTREHLDALRARHGRLRGAPLHAAVIVMDAHSGDILAYVGGDPSHPDDFDRARRAARQTGSTIKPLVLLEAYDDCGDRRPIRPTTLVADRALNIDGWSPKNYDNKGHGNVPVERALVRSYNRPTVRIGVHCGPQAVANTVRRAGLPLPIDPPLPFLLGSHEATPAQVVQAHSTFANSGVAMQPRLVERVGRSRGSRTGGEGHSRSRVAGAGATWLVNQGLDKAVREGTGRQARLRGSAARGKTGTTSGSRDAWFVGHADGLVAVVWVGLDKGELGLGGGSAAAPLWRQIMQDAIGTRAPAPLERPSNIVPCRIDPATGMRAGLLANTPLDKSETSQAWCQRGNLPRRQQVWTGDARDLIE